MSTSPSENVMSSTVKSSTNNPPSAEGESNSRNGGASTHRESSPADAPDANTRHPENPFEGAKFWSRLWFRWAYPIVRLGSKRPLEDMDLPRLLPNETSAYQRDYFERLWRDELERVHKIQHSPGKHVKSISNKSLAGAADGQDARTIEPNLARAVFWDYWKRTRRARMFLALNMAVRIVQTIALGRLLRVLEEPLEVSSVDGETRANGIVWASILVLCGMIAFPTKQQQFFETYRVGVQLRVSMVSAIFAKVLRLPSIGLDGSTSTASGHITNLASNDVEKFLITSVTSNYIVLGPIETLIVLCLGTNITGPSFLAGFALLCLLVPMQFFLSRKFASLRKEIAALTDSRVGWISQAVQGARIMKQSGFEYLFLDRITEARRQEIRKLHQTTLLRAMNEAIYFFTTATVAMVIFSVRVATGNSLSPELVYTTLSFLNIMQFTLTKHIPYSVMGLSECCISCNRLQAFLATPDLEARTDKFIKVETEFKHKRRPQLILSYKGVTCYWDDSRGQKSVAISDINFDFNSTSLYCVIGRIGSGKSALLQSIMGELPIACGTVQQYYKDFSSAPQEPWVMNGTVRENILMGCQYEQAWYNEVIDACALDTDLLHFSDGDMTIVGDRGVQCSGGQKARIGLARAIYRRSSKILLLDDPLSAVDPKVAKKIFFSAILHLGVEKGKCVVLVTHQHQFVGRADKCIFMEKGRVLCMAAYSECVSSSKELLDMSALFQVDKSMAGAKEIADEIDSTPGSKLEAHLEKRTTGVVQMKTWRAYIRSLGGSPMLILYFGLFVVTQATLLISFVLLGQWGDALAENQSETRWYTSIAVATGALVVLSIVRAQFSFYTLVRCSQNLHDEMVWALLRAQIKFFDTNPVGRILNRVSADVGIVDELLPLTAYDFFVGAFMFLGSVGTAIYVLPHILLVLPALFWAFLRLRSLFVKTSRELKRLEGLSRSPIYALLGETLSGIAAVRGNVSKQYMQARFLRVHDTHTRAAWAFMATSRWFATALDFLSFILLSTATFVAIGLHYTQWFEIKSSILGLALTLLLQMANTNFPWMVRQSAELTNQMVSVERITELSDTESEGALETEQDQHTPEGWPLHGQIRVTNLSTRYRPSLPLALRNITFEVPATSRVGVIGRTGSGKSTLAQAFFRLLEAEAGQIFIDGIDISKVGLHHLRKNVSIIPQNPTLFAGCTIKENLDWLGNHTDASIWNALNDAHLDKWVSSLPNGLSTIVAEGGSNFSVGQRQLLCLARAVLKRNAILILDEVTANVDRQTDQILQETLLKSSDSRTIFAIAHRLETVLNYDWILVLDHGQLAEQGSPAELLKNPKSIFASMSKHAGHNMIGSGNEDADGDTGENSS